jgi:hypothetical protein
LYRASSAANRQIAPVAVLAIHPRRGGGIGLAAQQGHRGNPPTVLRLLQRMLCGRFEGYRPHRLRCLEQELVQRGVLVPQVVHAPAQLVADALAQNVVPLLVRLQARHLHQQIGQFSKPHLWLKMKETTQQGDKKQNEGYINESKDQCKKRKPTMTKL